MRRSHRQTTFLSQDDSELRMDGCCHCDSTQVEKKSKGEKRRCYDVQEEEEGDCEDPEPIQKNKRTISKPSREHPPARPHRRTPNHKIWGMITILKKRIEKYSTTSTHLRGNIQRLQDKLAKNEANLDKWGSSLGKYEYEDEYRKEQGITDANAIGITEPVAEAQ